MRGSIVGLHVQPGRPALGMPLGAKGEVLIHEHTDSTLLGRRCGKMWGELAPPGDKPGTLHWCARTMSKVVDPDTEPGPDQVSIAAHPGRHRCTCGEYHDHDDNLKVACRFPLDGTDGPECGVESVGLRRETTTVPGSMMRKRPALKFSVVRSNPCGHTVRRGF